MKTMRMMKMMSNDKLERMFELQKSFQKQLIKTKEFPVDSVKDFHYSMTALMVELGEVMCSDKRWKNSRNSYYDRDEKKEELVDCMAFMINAILYSGIDCEEFFKAFKEKVAKNFERMGFEIPKLKRE